MSSSEGDDSGMKGFHVPEWIYLFEVLEWLAMHTIKDMFKTVICLDEMIFGVLKRKGEYSRDKCFWSTFRQGESGGQWSC